MKAYVFEPGARYKIKLFLRVGVLPCLALLLFGLFNETFGGLVCFSGIALMWFFGARVFVELYYDQISYEVYEDEVIVYVGLLTKSVKHVPFRTITNLELKRDPVDRLLDLGTLNILTAGSSGQQGPEENLYGLNNLQEVYRIVAAGLRRYRGALGPDQASEERASAPDGQVLGDLLDEVRAIRGLLERLAR